MRLWGKGGQAGGKHLEFILSLADLRGEQKRIRRTSVDLTCSPFTRKTTPNKGREQPAERLCFQGAASRVSGTGGWKGALTEMYPSLLLKRELPIEAL